MNIHHKRRGIASLALVATLALTGCSRDAGAAEHAAAQPFPTPVTVTNCERTTTFDAPPQRIIPMNAHVTEVLILMGVADRIVGMGYGETPNPMPEVADRFRAIPSLARQYPTAEQIRDLEPDLVVGGMRSAFDAKEGRDRDLLEAAGIDTFLFSEYCGQGFPSIGLLEKDFADLGALLGVPEAAATLTAEITQPLAEMRERLTAAGAAPVPTFFYDGGENEPLTIGGVGIGNLIAEYAGARNITADGVKPYTTTTWETVGERAPEAIVVLDYGNAPVEQKLAYLRGHPIMSATPAVREDRIVVLPLGNFFEGPRMVDAVRELAGRLHPTVPGVTG
ncbi:ABC transporter substrate-binding protein [Rhodococcus sp. NPDC058505]|uniref:ABC transporter substrate-binding protein n=1 Tax=unclassified Rhodococcus (in: high G+C Gram-positive bacteria) TaxID=192944 RepID=UPI00365F575E